MKKLLTVLLAMTIIFSLSGCAFAEFLENEKNAVDLGDGEEYVKWHLVENDNEYSAVESAYFEFCKDSFRYYENGELKREGEVGINYYGVEKGTEKYDAIVKNNLVQVLNTTFGVADIYEADLVAEAEAFLMEDAGLTADEVAALKVRLG